VAKEAIEKSGSWFSFKGERIGQGRDNARQFLKENPDIRARLEAELRKSLGLPGSAPEEKAPEPVAPSPGSRRAAGR
jgi:recombination protein RecA